MKIINVYINSTEVKIRKSFDDLLEFFVKLEYLLVIALFRLKISTISIVLLRRLLMIKMLLAILNLKACHYMAN